MEYDFEEMRVSSRNQLVSALTPKHSNFSQEKSFRKRKTPQGFDYWGSIWNAKKHTDESFQHVKDMIRQWDLETGCELDKHSTVKVGDTVQAIKEEHDISLGVDYRVIDLDHPEIHFIDDVGDVSILSRSQVKNLKKEESFVMLPAGYKMAVHGNAESLKDSGEHQVEFVLDRLNKILQQISEDLAAASTVVAQELAKGLKPMLEAVKSFGASVAPHLPLKGEDVMPTKMVDYNENLETTTQKSISKPKQAANWFFRPPVQTAKAVWWLAKKSNYAFWITPVAIAAYFVMMVATGQVEMPEFQSPVKW